MKICVQNDFFDSYHIVHHLEYATPAFASIFFILNKSKNPRKSEGHIQTNY